MAGVLRGRLLGRFEVSVDGRAIERSSFERPSGARLLKLLLATPGHRVRREAAAEALWPEADPDRSAANLRKALFFARRALEGERPEGESIIGSSGDSLRIDERVRLDLDVDRLRAALEARADGGSGSALPRTSLEILADLAGEELLPEDPYEEWLVPLRERIAQQTLDALRQGASAARRTGDRTLAFRLVDRALAIDPADEGAHRLAVELHVDAGQLHAARRQLLACARALAETYGVEPSPELSALIEAAAARRASAPLLAGEAPIIGRRRELEAAEAALDAVSDGRLGMMIYRGAAGIGKSRVLRELAHGAVAAGWRVVAVRGLESSPGAPFGDLGRGLAAALGSAVPEELVEPGRSALQAISPAFGGTAAVGFSSDTALVAGVIDALGALARLQPLAVVVDDIQWLDRQTIELLGEMVRGLPGAPVLLAGTVRDAPDRPPASLAALLDQVEGAGGRVVVLGPIGQREVVQLLERDLGARLEPSLAEAIIERSGGAPLFALEVARAARDLDAIVERDGTWRLAADAAALPVPSGVSSMVERRTVDLPEAVSRILAIAAELGDEIRIDRLIAATSDRAGTAARGTPVEVLDALDAGLGAGLLVERGGGYAFGHPLFRAALRATVRPRARADVHLRVAEALAEGVDPRDRRAIQAAMTMGRDVVTIAAHAIEAVELGREEATALALGFGFAAGDREAALFNHRAATSTLQRALALWDRLPAEVAQAFPAASAAIQLGWSLSALGDEPAAAQSFRGAVGRARDDAERALAWQAVSWMPYQHGRFEEADALLIEALTTLTDPVARASIEADRAWIAGRRGDWSGAYTALRAAVDTLDRAGAPSAVRARSLDRLGVAMRDSTGGEGAVPVLVRALHLAREAGDPRLAGIVQMHLADAYRHAGSIELARREVEAALHSTSMTGDAYIAAVSTWIAAEIEHAAGNIEAAIDLRRQELDRLRAIGGNDHNQAMAHAHIAHLAALLGDRELRERSAESARLIARHAGLPHLPARIEAALESATWFPDAPARGSQAGNAAGTSGPHDPTS